MRQTIVVALIAAAFAVATKAEVRCPVGVTCIDAGAGVTSPITTDPVSATGVWTFNNAANTPATFSDGIELAGPARFTGSSRGFDNGALRLEDDGADNYVILAPLTDVTTTRTWSLNFGNANRTLTLTSDVSLGTGSSPTFAGLTTTGNLTPVGRLMLPMAEISYFSTTGTTVTISGTSDGTTNMVKAAPTTTLNNDMEFDNGGADNGRLRYTGAVTKVFHVACTFSLTPATNNDNFVVGIAKNGTVVAASKVIMRPGTTADTDSTAMHAQVSLATNEYLEIFVGNLTGARNATLKTLNLFAMGM